MVADGVDRARERGRRRGYPTGAVTTTRAPALPLGGNPGGTYEAWWSVSATAGRAGGPSMVAGGIERARERGGRRGYPVRAVATTPAPALPLGGNPVGTYGVWWSVSTSTGAHGCPAPASLERDHVAGGAVPGGGSDDFQDFWESSDHLQTAGPGVLRHGRPRPRHTSCRGLRKQPAQGEIWAQRPPGRATGAREV